MIVSLIKKDETGDKAQEGRNQTWAGKAGAQISSLTQEWRTL